MFLCTARYINHTGKDNSVLLSDQVIGKIGNHFSFEGGKDKQFLVLFYRRAKFDGDHHLGWRNGNLESSKDLPKILQLVRSRKWVRSQNPDI